MPKSKIKLQHCGMKMIIPMYRFKTFQHLKEEVEHRYKLKVNGFVVNKFHISYDDELGDILENSTDEIIEVLTNGCSEQKIRRLSIESKPNVGAVEKERSGKSKSALDVPRIYSNLLDAPHGYKVLKSGCIMNLCERVTKLEARLAEYEMLNPWLVPSSQENAVVTSNQVSDHSQEYEKLYVQPAERTIDTKDITKIAKSSSDNSTTNLKSRSDHEIISDWKKNQNSTPGPISQINKAEPKIQKSMSKPNLTITKCEPKFWKTKWKPKKESPQNKQRNFSDDEPKRTPRVEKVNSISNHWAIVEKNLAARRRKRLKAEREERALRDKPGRTSQTSKAGKVTCRNGEPKTSIRGKVMKKVEQFTYRKGARSEGKQDKLEKGVTQPERNSEETAATLSLEHSENRRSSRRPQIGIRVANRMKQRPQTEFVSIAKRSNSPTEHHTKNGKQFFIDGEMSKKEAKRIERMKLEIGDKLEISAHREGILKFIGQTDFSKGTIFGIELQNGSLGDNSGKIDGVRYFSCRENRGVFIDSKNLRRKFRKMKAEPRRSVYRRRIVLIFEQLNPNKLKNVDNLLDKYEGKEHMLYSNVCKKYLVSPEQEYKDNN